MGIHSFPEVSPVYDLQTMLYGIDPDSVLGRDGIFGQETHEAVVAFQKKHGLAQNGKVDQALWDLLRKEYRSARVERGQAEPLLIVLQPGQVIEVGGKNAHLYLVQGMLQALALYFEMPSVAATGVLDPQTKEALQWLQCASELPQHGAIDRATWRHLANLYRQTVGDGTGVFPYRVTHKAG